MAPASRVVLLSCAVALGALALPPPSAARTARYLTGNAADVSPVLAGPAQDLGGGSTDVDAALQAMIDKVRGCTDCSTTVDVVVLRASGGNGYNDYIYGMKGVDSVETLVITKARDANAPAVEATVKAAEVVFFAGGDQCDYVRYFKGTRVESAVKSVYARGGGVGGTSAGLAILGEFVFDACRDSALSKEALANPYYDRMRFTYGFFAFPNLQGVLTDSHFSARDRMGRLLAFLARQVQDGKAPRSLGLGVNEKTSVLLDKDGVATVMGAGPAYFVHASHAPEVCRPGVPLTYSDFEVCRVPSGSTYDLRTRPTDGCAPLSVTGGVLSRDPY